MLAQGGYWQNITQLIMQLDTCPGTCLCMCLGMCLGLRMRPTHSRTPYLCLKLGTPTNPHLLREAPQKGMLGTR